jgi:hypothetical protein
MQHFLSVVDDPDKDPEIVAGPDTLIVGSPSQVIRKDVHLDDWPGSIAPGDNSKT